MTERERERESKKGTGKIAGTMAGTRREVGGYLGSVQGGGFARTSRRIAQPRECHSDHRRRCAPARREGRPPLAKCKRERDRERERESEVQREREQVRFEGFRDVLLFFRVLWA